MIESKKWVRNRSKHIFINFNANPPRKVFIQPIIFSMKVTDEISLIFYFQEFINNLILAIYQGLIIFIGFSEKIVWNEMISKISYDDLSPFVMILELLIFIGEIYFSSTGQ